MCTMYVYVLPPCQKFRTVILICLSVRIKGFQIPYLLTRNFKPRNYNKTGPWYLLGFFFSKFHTRASLESSLILSARCAVSLCRTVCLCKGWMAPTGVCLVFFALFLSQRSIQKLQYKVLDFLHPAEMGKRI